MSQETAYGAAIRARWLAARRLAPLGRRRDRGCIEPGAVSVALADGSAGRRGWL
jgi:hypothetical protein